VTKTVMILLAVHILKYIQVWPSRHAVYMMFVGQCIIVQPGHYSSLTTPNLLPTANQGMYNFRFTILSNTNNTSNYQSTNETHYTQENATITTHKGPQLLILIETHRQLQPSNKELHTEHTPLRTIILH